VHRIEISADPCKKDRLSGSIRLRGGKVRGKEGVVGRSRRQAVLLPAPVRIAIVMAIGVLMILCALPAAAAEVPAEPEALEVGTEVLLRSPQTELKVGPKVVATGAAHRLYHVALIRGEWVWIVAGDVRGWVRPDEVVTFREAMADYDRRIGECPHAAGWAYFQRGNLWLHKREGALAVADFNEALAQSPNDSAILHNRGLAWGLIGEHNQAIADFTEALRLDPNYGWAYEDRGRSWATLGASENAIADFTAAIQLDRHASRALLGRGLAFVETGQPELAIADLTEALRLNANLARAYTARGLAWKARHDYDRALEDLDKAVAMAPNDADAHGALATIRATCPDARFRNGQAAYEAATRAYLIHGKRCPHCLDTLAAAYAECGDFPRAHQWERKAIAALPEGDAERGSFEARLALYRNNEPFREVTPTSPDALAVAPAPADGESGAQETAR
jgi:tetratricopeptide (TPR) repeat protein